MPRPPSVITLIIPFFSSPPNVSFTILLLQNTTPTGGVPDSLNSLPDTPPPQNHNPHFTVVCSDRPMCSHVFPVLYLNLGVEMLYVLNTRVRSRGGVLSDDPDTEEVTLNGAEDQEKSDKVMKEIIMGLLSKKTLTEVFTGFGIPTRSGLKIFFEKVAHCSIVRLNQNSMDKLYDLMMMSFKYALLKITMPEQIMTITVNHLRSVLDLVPLDKEVGAAVEHAYTMAYQFYRPLGPMGWYMIRNTLLVFFQDAHVKVSRYLQEKTQSVNGKFMIYSKNIPMQLMDGGHPVGETKYFSKDGEVTHTSQFPASYKCFNYENLPDTLDAPKRSTDLGYNQYKKNSSLAISGGGIGRHEPREGNDIVFFETLMSTTTTSNIDESQIWGMSLFDDEADEQNYIKETAEKSKVTRIDAGKKKKSLKTAMDEMKLDKNRPPTAVAKKKTKGASVLDLMDEAAARPATAKPKAKRSESTGTPVKPRTRSGTRPGTGERATSAAGPKRAASAKRKPV